jgi:predicted nucleic acid-binding protein
MKMTANPKTRPIVQSDSLPGLLDLMDKVAGSRSVFGDVLQVVVVLDASAVQRELRWRLAARKDEKARTDLHEAIVAGTILPVAPLFLEAEIEEHSSDISEQEAVSMARVQEEWELLRPLILFYDPLPEERPNNCVDPDDVAYLLTLRQLDADFVFTWDRHFTMMGAPVMPSGLDSTLRDYARSSSVLLSVKLGSGFVLLIGSQTVHALATLIAGWVRKLPPFVKLLLGIGVGIALLHPESRKKIVDFGKSITGNLKTVVLTSLSSEIVKSVASSAQQANSLQKTIAAVLRPKGKLTAISYACRVCIKADRPLSVSEIATRIQQSGYTSRSKNFAAYVRRILLRDPRIVMNSSGHWLLRTRRAAA